MNEKEKKIKKAIKVLHDEIPNLNEFYSDDAVRNVLLEFASIDLQTVSDDFVDEMWEEPIRRCSHCGCLMQKGYWLDDEYACSDECRNAIYKRMGAKDDEEAEKFYLRDYYCLEDEDIKGKTAAEIEEEFGEYEGSDCVMYTEWC